MQLKIIGKFLKLKCNYCRETFNVDGKNCKHTCDAVSERSMGTEYEHHLIWRGKCPECKRDIVVDLLVFEYPEGCANWVERDATGASFAEIHEMEFVETKRTA